MLGGAFEQERARKKKNGGWGGEGGGEKGFLRDLGHM